MKDEPMHRNCVVVIPPESVRGDIPKIIDEIMAPFEGDWWDWYQIGGCFVDVRPAVRRLADVSPSETAERVIVADPAADHRLMYMTQREWWNGVNLVKSTWDGHVLSAVDAASIVEHGSATRMVDGEWLAVTVDYHS